MMVVVVIRAGERIDVRYLTTKRARLKNGNRDGVQCKVLRGVLRWVMLSGSTTQRGLRRLTSEASVPFVQRKPSALRACPEAPPEYIEGCSEGASARRLCSKWTDASLVDRCGVPWVVDPLSMTEGRLPGQRMCPRKTLNHTLAEAGDSISRLRLPLRRTTWRPRSS